MQDSERFDVLLVEDSPSLAQVYAGYLRGEPVVLKHVETGREAIEAIGEGLPKAVLLDLQLPDMNGMAVLKHVREHGMPSAVIIITAHGSVDVVVEAMHYGASDFLEKPFTADRLVTTLRNTLERQRLAAIVATFEESERGVYEGFVGSSLKMQAIYRMIDSAAPSNASVFITGESGTGKELCAEAIHKRSPRRDQAFVAINCAAIPKELIESEIFGHVKGAFTGASSERQGAASRADGGTLFLDEIAEMDVDLQAKLLRFIQSGTFQKLGGNRTERVDVRFLCATNRDPAQEVARGRLREDLYYRLHVIPIELPALRERDDDVVEIAARFLGEFSREENKSFARFSPEFEDLLRSHSWPGNVRELQNVIRNVVVLHQGEEVTADMAPAALRAAAGAPSAARTAPSQASPPPQDGPAAQRIRPLRLIEKEAIEDAVKVCGGNVPKAAALLEVSPSTIYRKRQTWQEGG